MNPVILIATEKLHVNPDNPLPPLSETDYNDLYLSIERHGILDPLFVVRAQDDPNSYTVIAGNHRLKVAQALGISEVPCVLVRHDDMDSVYDTELYRRVLTKQEREFYARKIHEAIEKQREEKIKASLIDELYQLHTQKRFNRVQLNMLLEMSQQEQQTFYKILTAPLPPHPEPVTTEQLQKVQKAMEEDIAIHKELEKEREKTAQYEERIKELERAKAQLEKSNRKAQEALVDKLDELEAIREQSRREAAEELRAEVEERLAHAQEQVAQTARAIKEKDREIEAMQAERDRALRAVKDHMARINAVWQASREYYDQLRDAMNTMFHPNMLRKRITSITNELEMLELAWTSYFIEPNLREETLQGLRNIQKKTTELLKSLPEIVGPQLPVITEYMLQKTAMLSYADQPSSEQIEVEVVDDKKEEAAVD